MEFGQLDLKHLLLLRFLDRDFQFLSWWIWRFKLALRLLLHSFDFQEISVHIRDLKVVDIVHMNRRPVEKRDDFFGSGWQFKNVHTERQLVIVLRRIGGIDLERSCLANEGNLGRVLALDQLLRRCHVGLSRLHLLGAHLVHPVVGRGHHFAQVCV